MALPLCPPCADFLSLVTFLDAGSLQRLTVVTILMSNLLGSGWRSSSASPGHFPRAPSALGALCSVVLQSLRSLISFQGTMVSHDQDNDGVPIATGLAGGVLLFQW